MELNSRFCRFSPWHLTFIVEKKGHGFNRKCVSNSLQRREGNIPLTPFDSPNICPVQTSVRREHLLANATVLPVTPKVLG